MSHHRCLPSLLLLISLLFFSSFLKPSYSSTNSFIFADCSQLKYTPAGSAYESNLNSLLTSLVHSATYSSYDNFSILGSSTSEDVVYGLYQCRGDLSMPDCAMCVAHSVTQIGTICPDSIGAALQLEGCFIKYENTNFLGVEDKSVLFSKCGPSIMGYNQGKLMSPRDAVLAGLYSGGGPYRVGASGKVQGVAQCVGDLSMSECQDCVSESIGQLKMECVMAESGDVFLGKCYSRYSAGGSVDSKSGNGGSSSNDVEISFDLTKKKNRLFAITMGSLSGATAITASIYFIRKTVADPKSSTTSSDSKSSTTNSDPENPRMLGPEQHRARFKLKQPGPKQPRAGFKEKKRPGPKQPSAGFEEEKQPGPKSSTMSSDSESSTTSSDSENCKLPISIISDIDGGCGGCGRGGGGGYGGGGYGSCECGCGRGYGFVSVVDDEWWVTK